MHKCTQWERNKNRELVKLLKIFSMYKKAEGETGLKNNKGKGV